MGDKSYSSDDIIGKSLYAVKPVPLVRLAFDDSKPMYTVKPRDLVGVVDTYLSPQLNRSSVYWSFKDKNGRNYYAKHVPGAFNLSDLKEQGLKDTHTKIVEAEKKAEKENETFGDVVTKNIKYIGIIAALAILGKAVIDKKL